MNPAASLTTPRLLSVKEAAKALCISDRTLWTLTQSGRITAVKLSPRAVRYEVAELYRFIQQAKGGAR